MKKLLLSILLLASLNTVAQEFEWQWATRGGGTKQGQGESGGAFGYYSEQVLDIKVDDDNNYYFLTQMTVNNTEYDGVPVTVYNATNHTTGLRDIVLISTDCEGNLRWTQTIGGGASDSAYSIVLDHHGGLYVAPTVINVSSVTFPNQYLPPHFSPEVSLPILPSNTTGIHEGYKTGFLLKYNTDDGSLDWYKAFQGDVYISTRGVFLSDLIIDSQGTLHLLMGFLAGTHLDGLVVVPENSTNACQFYVVKFDAVGQALSAMEVPMEGGFLPHHTSFRYDESLNRYYLGGFRNNGSGTYLPLSYEGVDFVDQAFILAFNGSTGTEIWRKEITTVSNFDDFRIYDLEIDADSNIYIAGKYFKDNIHPVFMNGYEFPDIYIGNVEFIMRLSSAGVVDWMKIPDGYTVSNAQLRKEFYLRYLFY